MSKYEKEKLHEFSEIFKALSNPNRLHIFLRLVSCCKPGDVCGTDGFHRCAGELGEGMGIAPSTVSHHLKELRNAGLVRMERHGKKVECWVEPAILEDLAAFFTPGCDKE